MSERVKLYFRCYYKRQKNQILFIRGSLDQKLIKNQKLKIENLEIVSNAKGIDYKSVLEKIENIEKKYDWWLNHRTSMIEKIIFSSI